MVFFWGYLSNAHEDFVLASVAISLADFLSEAKSEKKPYERGPNSGVEDSFFRFMGINDQTYQMNKNNLDLEPFTTELFQVPWVQSQVLIKDRGWSFGLLNL